MKLSKSTPQKTLVLNSRYRYRYEFRYRVNADDNSSKFSTILSSVFDNASDVLLFTSHLNQNEISSQVIFCSRPEKQNTERNRWKKLGVGWWSCSGADHLHEELRHVLFGLRFPHPFHSLSRLLMIPFNTDFWMSWGWTHTHTHNSSAFNTEGINKFTQQSRLIKTVAVVSLQTQTFRSPRWSPMMQDLLLYLLTQLIDARKIFWCKFVFECD